ncbi:RNA polymerase sigma-70 factor [Mucilaginibacter sp. SG564]|uniref:RNA polymerase sigma-70 factor n=1 Tax=Mucilaginibacter sp. SG564 TaxID=2587022 RepID=UPI0015572F5C|nr:RNA polymerase sigma-70 factor [Mucilaginibacter sp. SG564]NOW96044.1 RNA polymerase sigma-70 factor (ECF subfamily) [Mucilaginibacter sp. SG564]
MRKYQLSIFTDKKLLALLAARDDYDAFTEIYFRYWKILLDAAYQRIRSREASEEIVQEVFLSLFQNRKKIEITSSLEAWLKTSLKYKVFNNYRSQQIHLRHLNELIRQNEISPLRPDEAVALKEIRHRIEATAAKLPDKCQQVFILSRFEHLSQQEIADRLGISLSTVKKHLTKAIAAMRTEFRDDNSGTFLITFFLLLPFFK